MAKDSLIQIRLSSERKANWQLRAHEAGMSLSSWIEGRCDAHPEKPYPHMGFTANERTTSLGFSGRDLQLKARSHHPTCNCQMCCK